MSPGCATAHLFHTIRSLITLATLDSPVIGPVGIVFSTAPQTATGSDGKTYYVKGCDGEVAFSEVVGCLLAREAGLRVPVAGVCSFNGQLCAGVEEVEHPIRTVVPWLTNADGILNRNDLYAVIAVDTWLATTTGTCTTSSELRLTMDEFCSP
jgi:hypothetical protein